MPDPFDGLEPASFDGIIFPVKSVRISCSLRDHVHEFPHVGGGDPEKLGRKLYTFQIEIPAFANLPKYPDLWPDGLAAMRNKWENEETRGLVVPTLPGSTPAYAFEWSQDMTARIRSGEAVSVSFREDRSADFVQSESIQFTRNSVEAANEGFIVATEAFDPRPSIFDEIQDAANQVLALRDQFNLYGNLIAAKIAGAIALIEEADATLDQFQDPFNHAAVSAMRSLWESLLKLAENVGVKEEPLRTFVVPREMSATEISLKLYQTTDRANDIMQLNGIPNPFIVRAGTDIRYYADQEA